MGKRKREDDDDDGYVDFCYGLQSTTNDGYGNNSYIYSSSRPYKRPKINPNFYKEPTVRYRYLREDDYIFREIEDLITNKSIVVDYIIEVNNSVLEDAYYQKKRQKIKEYGRCVEEAFLFHGTKESKVNSICKFNFDWRLNGSNKGHKFGKGVCFSRNAKYASNYSDRYKYNKVMIVAKVLIGNVCRGYHDMSIPPAGYDTSQKGNNGVVLVKYEDNEFFPAYVMYYHFREDDNIYKMCYCNRNKCRKRHDYYQPYYDYRYHYNYSYRCNYNSYRGNYGSESSEFSNDMGYFSSDANYFSFT